MRPSPARRPPGQSDGRAPGCTGRDRVRRGPVPSAVRPVPNTNRSPARQRPHACGAPCAQALHGVTWPAGHAPGEWEARSAGVAKKKGPGQGWMRQALGRLAGAWPSAARSIVMASARCGGPDALPSLDQIDAQPRSSRRTLFGLDLLAPRRPGCSLPSPHLPAPRAGAEASRTDGRQTPTWQCAADAARRRPPNGWS